MNSVGVVGPGSRPAGLAGMTVSYKLLAMRSFMISLVPA
jgi:hypothetical protein